MRSGWGPKPARPVRRGGWLLSAFAMLAAACGASPPTDDPASVLAPPPTATTDTDTDTDTDAGRDTTAGTDTDAEPDTTAGTDTDAEPDTTADTDEPRRLTVEVISQRPHDATAFTQGLEFVDGALYESTGRDSTLRRVDALTGAVIDLVDIDDDRFAEGLTALDDLLVQLSWEAGVAMVWRRSDLTLVDEWHYEGEGWGLCRLETGPLVMSDGTAQLTVRDPGDFTVVGRVQVTVGDTPLSRLNELECVGDTVWANVWKTDFVVGIDIDNGEVTDIVDASPLAAQAGPFDDDQAVLNGIAYDPGSDTFLMTGKLWPTLFEVRFVEP